MKTKRRILSRALGAVIASGLVFGMVSAQTAEDEDAGWQVCNETSYILKVATAFMYRDRVVSKGWIKLLPGDCEQAEASAGQPRYLYAESSTAYAGGIREWKGSTSFCVEDGAFRSDPAKTCVLTDKKSRLFISVDPKDPVTTLTEPEDYGRRATIAGLQRLAQAVLQIEQVDLDVFEIGVGHDASGKTGMNDDGATPVVGRCWR